MSGFGAYKIERYGEPFLEKIQDYCNEHSLSTRIELKQPTGRTKKQVAPRERASDTKRISYELYRSGKTIKEVATERSLAITTIETHLSYYITSGELDVNDFVPLDKQELIAAAEKYGRLGLKLLKDNLPEEISYMEIKMTVASLGTS
jgi:ATP-dependent DNA helicase RecQ